MRRYQRVLLKLSGEVLAGERGYGIDVTRMQAMASEVAEVARKGVQVAIVIGGGNIFRGIAASAQGMDRAGADYMGMIATVINGLALQDALEKLNVATRVQSAITMRQVAEPYIRRRAIRHLEKGRVVIFVSGTGNPYFTTDTAAALRAMEIHADVILKGTRVAGVYDRDPEQHEDAVLYEHLSYTEVLQRNLKVMDATAVSLCRDNGLPIVVFDVRTPGNIARAALGEPLGTRVDAGGEDPHPTTVTAQLSTD